MINGKSAGSWAAPPMGDGTLLGGYSQPSTPNGKSYHQGHPPPSLLSPPPSSGSSSNYSGQPLSIRVQSAHDSWGMGYSTSSPNLNNVAGYAAAYGAKQVRSLLCDAASLILHASQAAVDCIKHIDTQIWNPA